jgi:hypothetical protein
MMATCFVSENQTKEGRNALSEITYIRYANSQKIVKPNNF